MVGSDPVTINPVGTTYPNLSWQVLSLPGGDCVPIDFNVGSYSAISSDYCQVVTDRGIASWPGGGPVTSNNISITVICNTPTLTPTYTATPTSTSTLTPINTSTPSPTATPTPTPGIMDITANIDGACINGDTTGMPDNHSQYDSSYWNLYNGSGSPDIVYKFTLDTAKSLFINLCGTTNYSCIYVRTDPENPSTTLAYDTECDYCGQPYGSGLVTGVLQPGTYYLIVDGSYIGESWPDRGPFTLCLSTFTPNCVLTPVSTPVTLASPLGTTDLGTLGNYYSDLVGVGHVDYYLQYTNSWTFTPATAGPASISLDCFDDGSHRSRVRYDLYDSNTNLVANSLGYFPLDALGVSLTQQQYTVVVYAANQSENSSDYRLVIQTNPPVNTPTVTDTPTGTISPTATVTSTPTPISTTITHAQICMNSDDWSQVYIGGVYLGEITYCNWDGSGTCPPGCIFINPTLLTGSQVNIAIYTQNTATNNVYSSWDLDITYSNGLHSEITSGSGGVKMDYISIGNPTTPPASNWYATNYDDSGWGNPTVVNTTSGLCCWGQPLFNPVSGSQVPFISSDSSGAYNPANSFGALFFRQATTIPPPSTLAGPPNFSITCAQYGTPVTDSSNNMFATFSIVACNDGGPVSTGGVTVTDNQSGTTFSFNCWGFEPTSCYTNGGGQPFVNGNQIYWSEFGGGSNCVTMYTNFVDSNWQNNQCQMLINTASVAYGGNNIISNAISVVRPCFTATPTPTPVLLYSYPMTSMPTGWTNAGTASSGATYGWPGAAWYIRAENGGCMGLNYGPYNSSAVSQYPQIISNVTIGPDVEFYYEACLPLSAYSGDDDTVFIARYANCQQYFMIRGDQWQLSDTCVGTSRLFYDTMAPNGAACSQTTWTDGNNLTATQATIPCIARNTWYSYRVRIYGDQIMAKEWQTGAGEPDWQLTVTDPNLSAYPTGNFGFQADQGDITFRNLSVYNIPP